MKTVCRFPGIAGPGFLRPNKLKQCLCALLAAMLLSLPPGAPAGNVSPEFFVVFQYFLLAHGHPGVFEPRPEGGLPAGPFSFPEAMGRHNTLVALQMAPNSTTTVNDLINVPVVFDSQLVPDSGGLELRAKIALGFDVFTDKAVFSPVEKTNLLGYQDGGAAPTTVGPAVGPDLPNHPSGFPTVTTPRYFLSSGALHAVYEIHNVSQLPDDPICLITPTAQTVLVKPGDAVPNNPPRPEPTPFGQGNTFTDVSKPVGSANYAAWIGNGAGFGGTYTRRHSDGARFRVVGADGQDFGGFSLAFHGDNLIISSGGTSASGGIYKAHPEGQTPAELLLAHRTAYDPQDPNKQFRDGTVRDIDGDRAVIIGRAEGSVPAIFLWDIVTGQVLQVVRSGSPIPGGGTFASFETAAISVQGSSLSQSLVIFTARDGSFVPLGLFAYLGGEIRKVARAGDALDGLVIQSVDFEVDALEDRTLGFVVRFTNQANRAYLGTLVDRPRIDSIAKLPGGNINLQGKGVPNATYLIATTDNLAQAFTPLPGATVTADSDGNLDWQDLTVPLPVRRFYQFQIQVH